jgi:hypothetical protein
VRSLGFPCLLDSVLGDTSLPTVAAIQAHTICHSENNATSIFVSNKIRVDSTTLGSLILSVPALSMQMSRLDVCPINLKYNTVY